MVRDFSQKTVQELYETIRVNVDEEEQWKVFDFVEDFFMEELEIGDISMTLTVTIYTGYQNAKDIHEQEQSAYEMY